MPPDAVNDDTPEDPRLMAAVDMLRRTGSREFGLRYQDDEPPTVWVAYAGWARGDDGMPQPAPAPVNYYDAAGAMSPLLAVLRLCEQAIDGATCAYCHRPTMFDPELRAPATFPLFCAYQFDPELATFRRSCEGDTETPPTQEDTAP